MTGFMVKCDLFVLTLMRLTLSRLPLSHCLSFPLSPYLSMMLRSTQMAFSMTVGWSLHLRDNLGAKTM